IFLAFFFNHSSTAARMHHPTERCRSLANFSKPWSCSALSRILKISILMYDSVLHNDYRCQPQIATTANCHSLTSPLKEEDCARARFRRFMANTRRTNEGTLFPSQFSDSAPAVG